MPSEFDPVNPYAGMEAWECTSEAKTFIAHFTGQYGAVEWLPVQGVGDVFYLTPRERAYNSTKVKDEKNDPFKNGTFICRDLVDDTPADERIAIESNPAMLTDAQIAALFNAKKPELLTAVLEKIENPIVVKRILAIAQEADLRTSQINAIESRLEELQPTDSVMIPATNEVDMPELYQDMGQSVMKAG